GGAHLTVTDSTFRSNRAVGAAGTFFGIGGAIENNAGFNDDSPSTAVISDSSFVGNVAGCGNGRTANGGAPANEGAGATMALTDALLVGNQALGGPGADGITTLGQGLGGGILNALGATMTVLDSTLVGNLAAGGDHGTPTAANPLTGGGVGGGIA